MKAYLGNPELKSFVLAQLEKHRIADEIIQGSYGDENNNKGCAVGCTLRAVRRFNAAPERGLGFHGDYETHLGIPIILARLQDRIHEGLSQSEMKTWPSRFATSIKEGSDLSLVWPKFALWLMAEFLPRFVKPRSKVHKAIKGCEKLYEKLAVGETVSMDEVRKVNAAAYANAANASAYAAANAAYANAANASAYAAANAAYAYAANASAYAAYAAANAANAYANAYAANAAAAKREESFLEMSNKLCQLLSEAT